MKHRYLDNVVTLALDEEKCTGCGMCLEVCPRSVFDVIGDTAFIVDKDACMECGACDLNCHANAIRVDAGVGCASAFIFGWLNGEAPECGGDCNGCC